MKTRFLLFCLLAVPAFGQAAPVWLGAALYPPNTAVTCTTAPCVTGSQYYSLPTGSLLSLVQNAAGSGMTVGNTITITCTGGGATTNPAGSATVLTATTTTIPLITVFGAGISTGVPTCTGAGSGGTNPTYTALPVYKNTQFNPWTYSWAEWQPIFPTIPFPNGTPNFTTAANANVTSVVCTTGYTCTNTRGNITITIGGSAASGNIAQIQFGNYNGSNLLTLPAAPGGLTVTGPNVLLSHTQPTVLGATLVPLTSIAASTVFTEDYAFTP